MRLKEEAIHIYRYLQSCCQFLCALGWDRRHAQYQQIRLQFKIHAQYRFPDFHDNL